MKIKSISIKNFKGIKEFKHTFNEKTNELNAINGGGKTSIKEAYFWCLGQDIKNIIPSKNNVEIQGLDIEVELKIEIDNVEFTLSRTQKEKYKLDKETNTRVKTGNESVFYIDGIEQKVAEYKTKLASMLNLSDYNIFNILSDIEFFNGNTNSWKWQNRRLELLKHINYDNSKILNQDKYNIIKDDVLKGYSLDELKKAYKKANSDLDKQKEKNLIIIEQLEGQIDPSAINEESYLVTIKGLEKEKAQYYESIKESRETLEDYKKLNNKLTMLEDREDMLNANLKDKKESSRSELERLKAQIETLSNTSEKKKCPYCNSELEDSKLQGLLDKLNKDKSELISRATKDIDSIKKQLEEIQSQKEKVEFELNMIQEEYNIEEITKNLNDNTKVMEIDTKIMSLKSCVLKAQKSLENKAQIEKLNSENMDLTTKSIVYVNKLNALNDYNVELSKDITKMVNDLFPSEVSFALFDFANYKGDLEDICLSMLNGKTYDECSTGEKYYLNFLITTTLQKLYNVELPIWCDNYECLSRDLISNSQSIRLMVSQANDEFINNIVKI